MIDKLFVERAQQWLSQPASERSIEVGAKLLLQATSNRIQYQNIMRNPDRYAELVEYQLQRRVNWMVADLTHEQVAEMSAQVDSITDKRHLDRKESAKKKDSQDEIRKGKRADHDSLPANIQQIFEDNMQILARMRKLHLELCRVSAEPHTCPDSERYPYLKEIIELDKQYTKNWYEYDHFELANTDRVE